MLLSLANSQRSQPSFSGGWRVITKLYQRKACSKASAATSSREPPICVPVPS